VGYLSVAGVAASIIVTLTFRSANRRLRFAILGFWSTVLLSLGGTVKVGGASWGWLPWRLIERLPLVADAIPNRLALFSFTYLVVALVLTVQSPHPPWLTRTCKSLIVAIGVFLLPVAPFKAAALDTAVVDSIATTCDDADVLVVPRDLGFGTFVGPRTMAWQAESDMRFNLVRGWAFRSSSSAGGDPLALDGLVAAPMSTDLAPGKQELRALAPVCLVAPLADNDALQRAINQPAVVQDGWRIWHIDQLPNGPDDGG
jgi:hypothetical protein